MMKPTMTVSLSPSLPMNLKSSKLVVGANLFSLSIAYTQNRANKFAPTITFATYSQIAKSVYGMVHRAQFEKFATGIYP